MKIISIYAPRVGFREKKIAKLWVKRGVIAKNIRRGEDHYGRQLKWLCGLKSRYRDVWPKK